MLNKSEMFRVSFFFHASPISDSYFACRKQLDDDVRNRMDLSCNIYSMHYIENITKLKFLLSES